MTEIEYNSLKEGSVIIYRQREACFKDFTPEAEYVVSAFYTVVGTKTKEAKDSYGIILVDDACNSHSICKEHIINDFLSKDPIINKDLHVINCQQVTSWSRALDAARNTVGKSLLDKEPSESWKAKMFLAEHSPIRLVIYSWIWKNIKCYAQQHLSRHHEGCEKFVRTQREDRNDEVVNRDELPQGAKQDFWFEGNIQSLINISRKRCCSLADKETRKAWKLALDEVEKIDPIIGRKLKLCRECVYRGFCPEIKSCGYTETEQYKKDLELYRKTDYGK